MSAPTEKELRELDAWIEHRVFGREIPPQGYAWLPEAKRYTTDPAAFTLLLDKCAEATDDKKVVFRKTSRGWIVTGSNTFIYVEAEIPQRALAMFARKMFAK